MAKGNPLCWRGEFTFELCCGAVGKPVGNPSCWDGTHTFESCCLPGVYEASCWKDARQQLGLASPTMAGDPRFANDMNLARFCCQPGHQIAGLCWGDTIPRTRPGGGELSFTRRLVQCCFPRLRYLQSRDSVPGWMRAQLNKDFSPWEHAGPPLQVADLDRFEELASEKGFGDKFCRFRIRKSGIVHCDFERMGYPHLLETLHDALHVLRLLSALPDMDFLVSVDELLCVDWHHTATPRLNDSVPVLAQAQPEGCGAILMPWWAFMQMGWTRNLAARIAKASAMHPWKDKVRRLFWRGSDTGCIVPGSCMPVPKSTGGQEVICRCQSWTQHSWLLFPRSKLVLSSILLPDQVDAKFTKDVVHEDLTKTFDDTSLKVNEIVAPEEHVQFKYLMYVDGSSFSDRLYWLLLTGSLVFRAASQINVWLDSGLHPWEHYIPVKEGLTDLNVQVEWARSADDHAASISMGANRFASEHLSLDASLFYLQLVLQRLAVLVPPVPGDEFDFDSEQPERVAEPPSEALNFGYDTVSCWSQGFTSELCCDTTEYGAAGNLACWGGPYTYEACCL